MSVKCIPAHAPLLYIKTGFTGVYFLIQDRLWVLVRTASVSQFLQLKKDQSLSNLQYWWDVKVEYNKAQQTSNKICIVSVHIL